MTAAECLRCGQPAKFIDEIGTPFCAPCARHQEIADPELAMHPIDEPAPCCDLPSAAPCDVDDCPGTRKEAQL